MMDLDLDLVFQYSSKPAPLPSLLLGSVGELPVRRYHPLSQYHQIIMTIKTMGKNLEHL
jgi:hypothetical protein